MVKPTSWLAFIPRKALAGARTDLSLLILTLLVYYALFRFPFWFPPRQRLWSLSYIFGFNNGVAILAMTVLLGVATLLYLLRRHESCEPSIAFPCERALRGERMLIVVFVFVALLYAGLTFAAYVYDVQSAPWLMWETRHLLHGTWLMDVYGLRPYTEIFAAYGPILTYAPLYMYWLLKPLGASHELAYFVCHLLLNLAGLWCAFYVLSRATMPATLRLVAFVILALAGFAPYMGINGVLIRYLFPVASLLAGHRVVMWTLSWRRGVGWWAGTTTAVLLLLAANILLSPEAGVAFALAWLGYALLMLRCEFRVLAVSLIALMAATLLCWLFLPAAYYGTFHRFSQGAENLPLLPAAHLLLYILTMFLVVPQLLAVSVRERAPSDIPGSAMCGALGVLCVVMMPGALGRCDPPHVLFYGMVASMLLMIRLANISGRAFAVYMMAYAGVFIVLMQLVNLLVFYGLSPRTLLSRHAVANVGQKLRSGSGTVHPDMATLSALDRYPRLGLPFASLGDPAVETYVLSRGQVEPEYYVSIVGVWSTAALERKLRDVGKAEYLLVPRGFRSFATFAPLPPPNPCAGYLKSLREWFLYPAKLPCRAEPLDPLSSVKSFIVGHYVPVEQVGSWLVLRRISSSSTGPSGQ